MNIKTLLNKIKQRKNKGSFSLEKKEQLLKEVRFILKSLRGAEELPHGLCHFMDKLSKGCEVSSSTVIFVDNILRVNRCLNNLSLYNWTEGEKQPRIKFLETLILKIEADEY